MGSMEPLFSRAVCLLKDRYCAQTYYVPYTTTLTLELRTSNSSNNARVSPHSCIKNSTRAWPMSEASKQIKAKVLFMHCSLCS